MKQVLYIVLLIIITGCNFKPIYSSKDLNFSIQNIEYKQTKLNNKFANAINSISDSQSNNNFFIKLDSKKVKITKTRNSKGDPEIFEIQITLNLIIKNNLDVKNEITFSEKINLNNSTDKFGLNKYEKELENILVKKIIENAIKYLVEIS